MSTFVKPKPGPLTFGLEIEVHIPVLIAPKDDSIQGVLEFPADEWYEKNCIFFTKEDGRKIPVVRNNVRVNKMARQYIWNKLLELFKETMEKPDCDGATPDIKVMTAKTEHPKHTFESEQSEQSEQKAGTSTLVDVLEKPEKPDLNPNVLGKFVDGHYEVYDTWTVCQDGSASWYRKADGDMYQRTKIAPIGPKEYSWFSIEIKSKVYKDLDLLERDLEKVCDRLRTRFLISINCGQGHNRTSTHVHVGRSGTWDPNDEDLPFSLTQAKKLTTAVYVLEHELCSLHAPWKKHYHRYAARLMGYTNIERFWEEMSEDEDDPEWKDILGNLGPFDENPGPENTAYTVDDFEMEGEPWPAEAPNADDVWFYGNAMELVWESDSMTKLAWLLACREGARRSIFSLHGLVPTKKGVITSRNLNTIEFRHMHGSLDVKDIMNWVRIIERIVFISTEAPQADYENFFESDDKLGKGLGLNLSMKPGEQVKEETLTPEVPIKYEQYKRGGEEIWTGMGQRMFLSKRFCALPLESEFPQIDYPVLEAVRVWE